MLNITSEIAPILAPTDFKIQITGITDSEGRPQDITKAGFYFKFFVGGYGPYVVSNTQNSVIENGKLYFIFQNYPFKVGGKLRYKQLTKVPDPAFSDGTQNIWTEGETPITFI